MQMSSFFTIDQNSYEHSHQIKIIDTCICNTFNLSVLKDLILKFTPSGSNQKRISVLSSLNMTKRKVSKVNESITLCDCGVSRYCNMT